jgi:hypothetical protein
MTHIYLVSKEEAKDQVLEWYHCPNTHTRPSLSFAIVSRVASFSLFDFVRFVFVLFLCWDGKDATVLCASGRAEHTTQGSSPTVFKLVRGRGARLVL